jgi:hypothetical protein
VVTEQPKTEAALYDLLQQRFGIGSWDEATAKVPFYRARMTEISKLKAMMKRRRVRIEEIVLAADYASARQIPIRETWQIFELVPDALKDQRMNGRADIEERLQKAAEEAMALGRQDWAVRLYNTDRRSGEAVLAEWEQQR